MGDTCQFLVDKTYVVYMNSQYRHTFLLNFCRTLVFYFATEGLVATLCRYLQQKNYNLLKTQMVSIL